MLLKHGLSFAAAALAANLLATTHEVSSVSELTTALANAADTGDAIHLSAGVYDLTAELVVSKGVRIYGDDFKTTVLRQTAAKKRVVTLNHADAKLEFVTVTGGELNSGWDVGAGVKIDVNGGTVSHCMVSNNVLTSGNAFGGGVGMKAGRLEHSHITGNTASIISGKAYGCGVGFFGNAANSAAPVVDTCLIVGNGGTANVYGGGIAEYFNNGTCMGDITIRNCTIACNASTYGGGVYVGNMYQKITALQNCIIAGNTATATVSGDYSPNVSGYHSYGVGLLTPKMSTNLIGNDGGQSAIGGTNVLGDPAFKSVAGGDYHLKDISAALKVGVWYEGIVADLDGLVRATPNFDCGCYEYVPDETFTLEAEADCEKAFAGDNVVFTAKPYHAPAGVIYTWTLKATGSADLQFTGEVVTNTLPIGVWSASLDASVAGESKATASVAKPITVGVRKMYVTSLPNENAEEPYDTAAKAATNLVDALSCSAAIDGTTLDLDEGTHVTSAEPIVTKGVRIVGRGVGKTSVKSSFRTKYGQTLVYTRVMQLNHADAVVSNLTLSGQVTLAGWEHGSVLYIGANGGTAARCRITGGGFVQGNGYGAGAALDSVDARLLDCEIVHCTNLQSKATALYCQVGLVRGCFIHDCHSAGQSQASVSATMGDIVSMHGDVTLESCTIVSNRTLGSTVGSVAVFANSLPLRVVNNIVAYNEAPNNATADSVASGAPNWATNGDLSKRTLHNCWYGSTQIWGSSGTTADPKFRNAAKGDYRLSSGSPCIGAGQVYDWMNGAFDLKGSPRLYKGAVDLGCYQTAPIGMLIFIR